MATYTTNKSVENFSRSYDASLKVYKVSSSSTAELHNSKKGTNKLKVRDACIEFTQHCPGQRVYDFNKYLRGEGPAWRYYLKWSLAIIGVAGTLAFCLNKLSSLESNFWCEIPVDCSSQNKNIFPDFFR